MYLSLVDKLAHGRIFDQYPNCHRHNGHRHSADEYRQPPAGTPQDDYIGHIAAEQLTHIDSTAKNGSAQAAQQYSILQNLETSIQWRPSQHGIGEANCEKASPYDSAKDTSMSFAKKREQSDPQPFKENREMICWVKEPSPKLFRWQDV